MALGIFILLSYWGVPAFAGTSHVLRDMVLIEEGEYTPLFTESAADPKNKNPNEKIKIETFFLDVYPVTNQEFLKFVKIHPQWRRSRAKKIFVESSYLQHWSGDLNIGNTVQTKSPVIYVSWFAAKAYCQWKGKRLPSTNEWEYVADMNEPGVKERILEWYAKPTPVILPSVGSTFRNHRGVWDIYGMIWEWTSDFNSALVTGESRGDSTLERNLFCGSGSIGSANPSDYAAFMRFGMRSSLRGNYTLGNLGFRCAQNKDERGVSIK